MKSNGTFLNDIAAQFFREDEPTYFTPVTVFGAMLDEQTAVINPLYTGGTVPSVR